MGTRSESDQALSPEERHAFWRTTRIVICCVAGLSAAFAIWAIMVVFAPSSSGTMADKGWLLILIFSKTLFPMWLGIGALLGFYALKKRKMIKRKGRGDDAAS